MLMLMLLMSAKADPAPVQSEAMPLSTPQHGARQWATVVPSGRELTPLSFPPDPLAVFHVQGRLGLVILFWGLSSAGTVLYEAKVLCSRPFLLRDVIL